MAAAMSSFITFNMPVTIVRPKLADKDAVCSLFIHTIGHAFKREGIAVLHASDIEREITEQINTLQRDLDSNGRDEYFLIARAGDKVVGTAAYGPANTIIRDNLSVDVATTPEIKSVYVLPEYQCQGIGTQLLQAIRKRIQDDGITDFCLDSGYTSAQRYWTNRLGEPQVVLNDYWGTNAHHMIWRRRVADVT
ncbi:MAG: GNAT family N-acetyltransferase [candidate division Zixibacteria bacterium]|nr:GNAT family N-acetyltransferase [candidate division Zixibacteria bacterium]